MEVVVSYQSPDKAASSLTAFDVSKLPPQLDYSNILASSSKPSKGKQVEVLGLFFTTTAFEKM